MNWLRKVLQSSLKDSVTDLNLPKPNVASSTVDTDVLSCEESINRNSAVTVYWRPGCPFCSRLFRDLRRHNIEFNRIDIWAQEGAAEFVRSVANGNETVPTVVVGAKAYVNPTAKQILAALESHA